MSGIVYLQRSILQHSRPLSVLSRLWIFLSFWSVFNSKSIYLYLQSAHCWVRQWFTLVLYLTSRAVVSAISLPCCPAHSSYTYFCDCLLKFKKIKYTHVCIRMYVVMTDRQTARRTEGRTQVILWYVPCCATAVGQIVNYFDPFKKSSSVFAVNRGFVLVKNKTKIKA